ncbi:class E sortase [Planosporangium flavigriseum]|uniref:LPXTG-site transpeptidase (Sortase) family protein n=1 Tax=Planosporangium flavigriseum TaxID=373681 RepID=A0A8J3LR03_9ACTN|nr:class E sortase [Planosporangium flavigriseum]NJC64413.1 class E sortase [Planosporangium flavigriseum]GIG72111.1 hypothetical protein Pfl04_05150 [Planosporangium flavigriseum]
MMDQPRQNGHRPRHSASDEDPTATAFLPRVADDSAQQVARARQAISPQPMPAAATPAQSPPPQPVPPQQAVVPAEGTPMDGPAPLPKRTAEARGARPVSPGIIWSVDPTEDEPTAIHPPIPQELPRRVVKRPVTGPAAARVAPEPARSARAEPVDPPTLGGFGGAPGLVQAAPFDAPTAVIPTVAAQAHSAAPADPEATALLPRIRANAGTPQPNAVLPQREPDADATAVIPKLRAPAANGAATPVPAAAGPSSEDSPAADKAEELPRGVKVVPLRPVRTEEGYRSVYSHFTRRTPATVFREVVRGVGELCITLGMILLLFAAYEVWGKTAAVNAHQTELDKQLAQAWDPSSSPAVGPTPSASASSSASALPPPDGKAIARMYIPRMGKQWIVVQGVTPADIRFAPGHYPTSAMPGQVGNFSVAGHRTPAIFWDLDQVKDGDEVVVETKDTWYVYRVNESHIVLPTAVEVVAPVPNQPGKKPTQAMLTITTCNPKFNNYQRLIVHAVLDPSQTRTRAQGRPAVLGS